MEEFTTTSERITKMRKKNKALHHDIIAKHQKMSGKYSIHEQEASGGLDETHPGTIAEDINEEIVYKPPFLDRLRGEDKQVSLPAYESKHSIRANVMSCALFIQTS